MSRIVGSTALITGGALRLGALTRRAAGVWLGLGLLVLCSSSAQPAKQSLRATHRVPQRAIGVVQDRGRRLGAVPRHAVDDAVVQESGAREPGRAAAGVS